MNLGNDTRNESVASLTGIDPVVSVSFIAANHITQPSAKITV
jgi:hypothetical protein